MKFTDLIIGKLQESLDHHWIQFDDNMVSCQETLNDIEKYAEIIQSYGISLNRTIFGLAMKTSYEFVISDLMAIKNNSITLPIPLDFEDEQIKSLLHNVDCVLVRSMNDANRLLGLFPTKTIINISSGELINKSYKNKNGLSIPSDVIKIIHTSGTTSNPKGVMIRDGAMVILLNSLLERFPKGKLNYLSIVPMSLLIEQVLGIYCPLISLGRLTLLPENMKEFGAQFSNTSDYLDLVKRIKPNFMYLAPKLLDEINKNYNMEDSLNHSYVITGGAKINHDTIRSLYSRGIKVYEGYGLSENSSVVSINGIEDNQIGTAGKFLSHVQHKVVDGELLIKSTTMCAGYFTKDDSACEITSDGYLHTGDLVEINDGYLLVKGRKKHVLILSNARNISPEWVESKLKKFDEIYDCIIFGDGMDYLYAIIMPNIQIDVEAYNGIINNVNNELPDFARIGKTIVIDDVQAFRNKFYTVTGRPRRTLIHKEYIDECNN